jgi:vancomycin resistance protein VanW
MKNTQLSRREIPLKPIRRSKLRLKLGTYYFRFKRYVEWYSGNKKYAAEISSKSLPYEVIDKTSNAIIEKFKGC